MADMKLSYIQTTAKSYIRYKEGAGYVSLGEFPDILTPYNSKILTDLSETIVAAAGSDDEYDIDFFYSGATLVDVLYLDHYLPTGSIIEFYGANVTDAGYPSVTIGNLITSHTVTDSKEIFLNFTQQNYTAYRLKIRNFGYVAASKEPVNLLDPVTFGGGLLDPWVFTQQTTNGNAEVSLFNVETNNENNSTTPVYGCLLEAQEIGGAGGEKITGISTEISLQNATDYVLDWQRTNLGTIELISFNASIGTTDLDDDVATTSTGNGSLSFTTTQVNNWLSFAARDTSTDWVATDVIVSKIRLYLDEVYEGFVPAPANIKRVSIGASLTPTYNYDWGASRFIGKRYSAQQTSDIQILHSELSLRQFNGVLRNIPDAEIDTLEDVVLPLFEDSYCIFQADPDETTNRRKYLGDANIFVEEAENYRNGHTVNFRITEIKERS